MQGFHHKDTKPKNNQTSKSSRERFVRYILLCLAGIAVNSALSLFSHSLQLPFALNTLGTILVSAVGGIIPGLIVAFADILLQMLFDPLSVYFSVISILVVLLSSAFYQNGRLKRFSAFPHSLCLLTLVSGGISAFLNWELHGHTLAPSVSSGLIVFLTEHAFSPFAALLCSSLFYSLINNVFMVGLAFLLLRIIPEKFVFKVPAQDRSRRPMVRLGNLRFDLTLFTCIAFLLLAFIVSVTSFYRYRSSILDQYSGMAQSVANMASTLVDADSIPRYLREGKKAEGYLETETALINLTESFSDIAFIYVYRIEEDGCYAVFDPSTEEIEGAQPGEYIPFDEEFLQYVPGMLEGSEVPPIVVNDQYGWLLTIYHPLFDSHSICQAYVGVDIFMESIMSDEIIFLAKLLSLFFSFLLLVLISFMQILDKRILEPINRMATASNDFAYTTKGVRTQSIEKLRNLDIQNQDEIGNLYRALIKTSEDTVHYINEAERNNQVIQSFQNGMILVLADLVESRDEMTGNHVRNTADFVQLILEEMRREHLYPSLLTPSYIQDVITVAPLHDIGKIHIPDSILNKPGKLTHDEFEQMKTHTTVGYEILQDAMETIGEASVEYLKEGQNVARYHHERFDGMGYPDGLKGEEIPLSARVMAVADVFDALISRRSYKEPFPFDQAVSIIQEESGTHFDPQVVHAFIASLDAIREVVLSHASHL